MSPGSPTRVLVGLWIATGLAAGSTALAFALSDGAPTPVIVVLVAFIGALVLLPLLVLRSLGAGRLSARHDRARLRGLFGATLDVNRSVGVEETTAAVLTSAGALLQSSEITLTEERPAAPVLAEPMQVA